jgi:hypothetical protein
MPILAEILKGLVVWMSREITQACCPEFFLRKLPSGFFLFNLFIFKEKQKHMQIQRHLEKTYHTHVQIYVNKEHLEKRITRMYKFTSTKDI